MRIPSYTQYAAHINLLSTQFDQLSRLQQQMSTQKKLLNSSDNPVLASTIKSTQNYMENIESYNTNIIAANRRSGLVENSLKNSTNSLQRITELYRSAQSDLLKKEDREKIAIEIGDILSSLLDTANARDANGDYLFSGIKTNQIPFSKVGGVYQYFGSLESSSLYTSENTSVLYNDSGYEVFGNAKQGNGYYTIRQSGNTGTAETSVGTVSSLGAYVEDTYTLTFSMNGSDLVYQVVGASSGTVIPVSPAPAPVYVQGETIEFNGINFDIKGQPNAGDSFVIAPSERQNIFETLNQMANLLLTDITNDTEKAAFHQKLGELGASASQGANGIANYLSTIGYRMRELDVQQTRNNDQYDGLYKAKGQYEDVNIFELTSELQARQLSLQVTQQTYVQLQQFFAQLLLSSSWG